MSGECPMRGKGKPKGGKYKGKYKGRRSTNRRHIRATSAEDDESDDNEEVQESGPAETDDVRTIRAMMKQLTPNERLDLLLTHDDKDF